MHGLCTYAFLVTYADSGMYMQYTEYIRYLFSYIYMQTPMVGFMLVMSSMWLPGSVVVCSKYHVDTYMYVSLISM